MLRIGELAQKAGVSKRTIDYYTTLGLIEAQRSSSNYRYYSEETVQRLKLIHYLKQEHLPLEEIKERLAIMDQYADDQTEKVFEKLQHIQEEMKRIETELLQLKPTIEKLDNKQVLSLRKLLETQNLALAQLLILVLFG
ncbi:DNA-binding transcriptional MerR regulator [Pullulanibacillus pueri]|uniref:MerR family transcriptional regulator n=1 Tax=Pullulanibacillus pueri TaxID=1437324 RepID=A0A8J3EM10_9BACL|nr:MerR family transcriptional regulator [Pullulanibacillus pueri]MBM7681375.1 DNA-binding transcriptional MerR regulator [Pullulanibacillus pueri]GGH78630.1 MerR family transcriptional regulator [Pullulanibacillus pueri]